MRTATSIAATLVLLGLAGLLHPDTLFACGGDNQAPCTHAKATYHHKEGRHGGAFDGLNGNCYECPSGYKHQGLYGVEDEHVCKMAARKVS